MGFVCIFELFSEFSSVPHVNYWTNLFEKFLFFYSDSLGDAGMAEGVPKTSSVLKIGFLFDHVRTKPF